MNNKWLRVIFLILLAIPMLKVFNIPGTISSLIQLKEVMPEAFPMQLVFNVIGIMFTLLAVGSFVCGLLSVIKVKVNKPLLVVAILAIGAVVVYNIFGITSNVINMGNRDGEIFNVMLRNAIRLIIENICSVAAIVIGILIIMKEGKIIYEEERVEELC